MVVLLGHRRTLWATFKSVAVSVKAVRGRLLQAAW